MRLEHPVAKLLEDLDRVCEPIVVVLDNENPPFAPPAVDAVLSRNLEISELEPRLLNRCILRSDEPCSFIFPRGVIHPFEPDQVSRFAPHIRNRARRTCGKQQP
jgi:hypothetical protein